MQIKDQFSSRWGIIFAGLGMAIGTGNIWRFPRVVSQNSGGAFMIAWLFFLFFWSIPVLIIEMSIGKKPGLARLSERVFKRVDWRYNRVSK